MSERAEPLPAAVPVFPLSGALLLPRGLLPLNIFEPRYLAMVRDAMAATGAAARLIGMVQPRPASASGDVPPLYDVGCLGRISDFRETEDGRILIALTGVSRFRIAVELDRKRALRLSWSLVTDEELSTAHGASAHDALDPRHDADGATEEDA